MIDTKPHDEAMAELYRKDRKYALAVMNSLLQEADPTELTNALRQLVMSFADTREVAARAGLDPGRLRSALAGQGELAFSELVALLAAINVRLTVEPLH